MLPDRIGLALLELHFDRFRINLADLDTFDPGKMGDLPAGGIDVERNQRGRAVKADQLQELDFGGLRIAGDLDVLDRKTRRRRCRLRDGFRVTAERHAVKPRRSQKASAETVPV